MSAVFNTANTASAIVATGPCVRILGLNLSSKEASNLSSGQDIETRVWHMSTESEIAWRPITNVNLSTIDDFDTCLQKEYDSVQGRLDAWNSWRTLVSQEVLDAAKSHVMRPVLQVRAMYLLAEHDALQVQKEPEKTATAAIVPSVSRNAELRGQSWALIGIIGDATYEATRSRILDTLGTQYFNYLKALWPTLESDDMESALMSSGEEGHSAMLASLDADIRAAKDALRTTSKEPMIAFFGASENPDDLQAKSDSLVAKVPSLLHADLAVVRMYSWIKLDHVPKRAKAHTSRDPKANDFYHSMAKAS